MHWGTMQDNNALPLRTDTTARSAATAHALKAHRPVALSQRLKTP